MQHRYFYANISVKLSINNTSLETESSRSILTCINLMKLKMIKTFKCNNLTQFGNICESIFLQ